MIVNILLICFAVLLAYTCLIRLRTNKVNLHVFMNKDVTNALRGIAIVLIVVAHICQAEPILRDEIIGGKYTYSLLFSCGAIGVGVFFLLSGYGCFISISKSDNTFMWLIKHIMNMLIYFIISFILVVLFRICVLNENINVIDCIKNIAMLKLPDTSSWYFKIQILFYFFLFISDKIKRNQCFIVSSMVFLYALIAILCGLQDYWWKTSMCFSVGCIIAKYRNDLPKVINKISVKLILLFLALISYLYIVKSSEYILLPQLFSYVCIALCIIIYWDWLGNKNCFLNSIGGVSLSLYLIHIGVVDGIYALQFNSSIKTIIFIVIISIFTFLSNILSKKCNYYIIKKKGE